jgi:hypothetical protein
VDPENDARAGDAGRHEEAHGDERDAQSGAERRLRGRESEPADERRESKASRCVAAREREVGRCAPPEASHPEEGVARANALHGELESGHHRGGDREHEDERPSGGVVSARCQKRHEGKNDPAVAEHGERGGDPGQDSSVGRVEAPKELLVHGRERSASE